jgi:cytochrome c-type biogenesis protein CcmH/NrfF
MKRLKRFEKYKATTNTIPFLQSYIYGVKVKAFLQLIGFIILCFTFISILVFISPAKDSKHAHIETKSSSPAIEEKVFEIASMFRCSCKKCPVESLEVCKCNRAIEERNLIRKCTEQEENVIKIVLTIAERYGFLKAEYANNYNVDKSQIWTNTN